MSEMNRQQRRRLGRAIARGDVRVPPGAAQGQMPPHLAPVFQAAKEAENRLAQMRQLLGVLEEAKVSFEKYEALALATPDDDEYVELRGDFDASYVDALKHHAAAALDFVGAVVEFEEARLQPGTGLIAPTTEEVVKTLRSVNPGSTH